MARARNIKPGFFKNEDLGTADPFVSLLFAGLWTLADKAGILEDRPLRIKAELFPYRDGFDINGYLTVLVSFGLIHRYEGNGTKLIQIAKFREHQNPHHTEKDSIYPDYSDCCDVTVKEPLNNEITPADSLIPDSLNTDSLIPDSGFPLEAAQKKSSPSANDAPPAAPPTTRGSRLSADWQLPRSWGEWALQEKSSWSADDVRKCAERFRDFWVAKTGKDATKADWEATWRNWVRRESSGVTGMTTAQRRMAATDRAIDEWLNEGSANVIDGECHA